MTLPAASIASSQLLHSSHGRFPISLWVIVVGLALLAVLLHFMTCAWGTRLKTKGIPILRFREVIADEGAAQKAEMYRNLCDEQQKKVEQLQTAFAAEKDRFKAEEYHVHILLELSLWGRFTDHLSEERARSEGLQGIWARDGTARDSAMIIGVLIPVLLLLGALGLLFSNLARRQRAPSTPAGR